MVLDGLAIFQCSVKSRPRGFKIAYQAGELLAESAGGSGEALSARAALYALKPDGASEPCENRLIARMSQTRGIRCDLENCDLRCDSIHEFGRLVDTLTR